MKYWIILLFVLGFLVRIRHVDGSLRWEERDIVPALRDISLHSDRFWIPPKAGDHTPLATLLAWPLYKAKPESAWILRIPSILLGSLIGPLMAYILSRITKVRFAILAGILITFNTFLINWSAYFMQEMSFQFFGVLGFVFLEAARRKKSMVLASTASVFFALGFWSHEFAVILVPLSFLYLLVLDTDSRSWLITWKPWAAVLLYGIMISPYIVWNISMKGTFSEHSGMSIAQQHIIATLLSNRGLNIRFLEYFVLGGLHDILNNPGIFELNHIDPLVGVVLLGSPVLILFTQHRIRAEIILASVVFWGVFAVFLVFDLQFRIYRLSVLLIPSCITTAYILGDMLNSSKKSFRAIAIFFIGYSILSGVVQEPYAAGAAHRGFRWWRKGPIFDEQPLVDVLSEAQEKHPASLVVMPGLFWDHVPLRAEYESNIRFVGGSRETIYSSTFWMRPYERDEARRLRAVLSCQEDVQGWWHWLHNLGYSGTMDIHEVRFKGILEDTTMVCRIFLFELENPDPPPVHVIIDHIYETD